VVLAMIESFVDEDYHNLHVLCDLRPWKMSPTRCHLWQPARGCGRSKPSRKWYSRHRDIRLCQQNMKN
jgi:hypothetical protein